MTAQTQSKSNHIIASGRATAKAEPLPKAPPATSRKTPRRRLRVMADEQSEDLSPVLAGVYIRVSTAREEMISPELQQRDVDAYLARMTLQTRRPWKAVVIEQDLDISGRSFARAGIQKLMEMMREGTITTILTYRYDRFGRNLQQALDHLEEVEQLGGQVVSVTEPMDVTTAIGHYMRSQSLALADLQSRQIGEGWKRVHQYRIDRGLPTNGRERYGYLSHRTTHTRGDGSLRVCLQGCAAGECQTGFVADPETAPVVQRIYQSYLAGTGFQAIAKSLNEDQVIPPGRWGAERSGNPERIARTATTSWTAGSVIDVADSGFAAGFITHNGQWFPGSHKALIDSSTWQAYQQRRDAQRIVPTKARSPKWSLAGIARCGQCGGRMYCTSSQRGEQYALYCSTSRTSGLCTGTYRTREPVEGAVVLWLQTVVRVPRPGSKLVFPSPPVVPDVQRPERHKLLKVIEASSRKLGRLTDAYTNEALDLAEFKRRRGLLQEEAEQAQARLAQLDQEPTSPPPVDKVRSLAENWAGWPVEERRALVGALLEKIIIHPDKTVELRPRWSDPVLVDFDKRGRKPVLRTTPAGVQQQDEAAQARR
jgi:site-specific DNA recombinase